MTSYMWGLVLFVDKDNLPTLVLVPFLTSRVEVMGSLAPVSDPKPPLRRSANHQRRHMQEP